jgi:hypothetical protein
VAIAKPSDLRYKAGMNALMTLWICNIDQSLT